MVEKIITIIKIDKSEKLPQNSKKFIDKIQTNSNLRI
jgi:hypothetical protein